MAKPIYVIAAILIAYMVVGLVYANVNTWQNSGGCNGSVVCPGQNTSFEGSPANSTAYVNGSMVPIFAIMGGQWGALWDTLWNALFPNSITLGVPALGFTYPNLPMSTLIWNHWCLAPTYSGGVDAYGCYGWSLNWGFGSTTLYPSIPYPALQCVLYNPVTSSYVGYQTVSNGGYSVIQAFCPLQWPASATNPAYNPTQSPHNALVGGGAITISNAQTITLPWNTFSGVNSGNFLGLLFTNPIFQASLGSILILISLAGAVTGEQGGKLLQNVGFGILILAAINGLTTPIGAPSWTTYLDTSFYGAGTILTGIIDIALFFTIYWSTQSTE